MFTSKALCDVCGSGPFSMDYGHPPSGSAVFQVTVARDKADSETVYAWVCPACSRSFLESISRLLPKDTGIGEVREAMKTGAWWPVNETLTPQFRK